MTSAKPKKKEVSQKDELEASILGRLTEELNRNAAVDEFSNDVTVLFCGMKKCGKTSLVDRFINPNKDDKDQPKPTVSLDYKFARYAAENSTSKVLAHIYDLGGDEGNDDLVAIPVSASTVGNLVLAVTLDLSDAHHVVPVLEKWLNLLRTQVNKSLAAFAKDSACAHARAQAVQQARRDLYAESPDAGHVRPFPVPLVIFGTKWDCLNDTDPEKRKGLCRALRHFAHTNGASLVFTSLKEKSSMNNARGVLRQLLFGVAAKGGLAEQLDSAKPICVAAGKDSFQGIGASQTDHAWREKVESLFPDPTPAMKGPKKSEADQISDDMQKFPEASVDGMVEQRAEELNQYRRQVERAQRLAGEGVEGVVKPMG